MLAEPHGKVENKREERKRGGRRTKESGEKEGFSEKGKDQEVKRNDQKEEELPERRRGTAGGVQGRKARNQPEGGGWKEEEIHEKTRDERQRASKGLDDGERGKEICCFPMF